MVDHDGGLVHNHPVPHHHAKYLIKSVLIREAISWGYEADRHCVGSFIVWVQRNTAKVSDRRKRKRAVIDESDELETETEEEDEMEQDADDTVVRIRHADPDNKVWLYAVMKQGLKVAEAELLEKDVSEGASILIKKISSQNIEESAAPDLTVGSTWLWPEEGLNAIRHVRYMEGEKLKLFYNNVQVGFGAIENSYQGS